jgi:toxin ParE1/3/4
VKLRVSRRARADLDSIWLHVYKRDGEERAQRLTEGIAGKFPLLAAQPGIGRRRDDLKTGLQSIPEGNYRIHYEQRRGQVNIVAIRHAARREKDFLG